MLRELNGAELQGFIKQRQLKQVRNLRQEHHIIPKLVIVKSPSASSVIDTYVRMKSRYAEDILVEIEVLTIEDTEMKDRINKLNLDSNVQGIIVQLPLNDKDQTDIICSEIDSNKDIDGLGVNALYPSATAQAIDWLLAGYGVSLEEKHIAILGSGKLVGNPLGKMWKARGLAVTMLDETSTDVTSVLQNSDIIVSATGVPRLVTSENVKPGAVIVDAGTASENGVLVGDVDESVRARDDITITPVKGGIGPLTIAVLFDHLIEACLRRAGQL